MVAAPKGFNKRLRKLETAGLTEAQFAKELKAVKKIVAVDIAGAQYAKATKDTFKTVNAYQGKRLAQDQLQRANNDQLVAKVKAGVAKKGDRKLVQVGYWRLSPSHTEHYYPYGEDPCEIHASHDEGYGEGGYTDENIKIPVLDSHFGCMCSVTLEVVEKK